MVNIQVQQRHSYLSLLFTSVSIIHCTELHTKRRLNRNFDHFLHLQCIVEYLIALTLLNHILSAMT